MSAPPPFSSSCGGVLLDKQTGMAFLVVIALQPCEAGEITYSRGLSVVYVDQEPEFSAGLSVGEAVLASGNPVMRALNDYQRAAQDLAGDPSNEMAEARFQKATQKMEQLDAWDFESFVDQVGRVSGRPACLPLLGIHGSVSQSSEWLVACLPMSPGWVLCLSPYGGPRS